MKQYLCGLWRWLRSSWQKWSLSFLQGLESIQGLPKQFLRLLRRLQEQQRPRSLPLLLEQLEDRRVPSVTTLASFTGINGAYPYAGLVRDSSGNLFGTTYYDGASLSGTVIELAHGSTSITALASFNSTNGSSPYAGLVMDSSGDLFGTTYAGGASYIGTVFEIANGSTSVTTLASFNGTNGAYPDASLVLDSSGNLFGTTYAGGASNEGTVFELANGSTSIDTLASFNGTNGNYPRSDLILDSSYNLLGTTSSGGANGYGTIFEVRAVSVSAVGVSATAGSSTGSINVASFTDNDPSLTSPSSFTATIYWGDGSSSTGTITSGSGSTFDVSGSHTHTSYGSFTTTVSVTDSNSVTGSDNNTATVASPVALTNPGTQNKSEGDSVSLSTGCTPSSGVSFSATGLPKGLGIDPTTGTIAGTIALGDASSGPYTTIVSASYGSYTASLSFAWNISTPLTWNSTIANQSSTEGATISLTTGATDTVSGSTIYYGALGLPHGLKINTSTGTITGTVAAGAAVNGPYTVTLIADDNTYSINQTFTWTVTNPITITPVLVSPTLEGTSVSLAISATDATSGAALAYSADGLPIGLKISSSTGDITGTVAPGAAQNGPYSVTVTAGDGTSSADMTFNWIITSPVVLTVPTAESNNEGDTVSLTSISATDAYSGTITFGAINLPAGLSISSSTGDITGTVASGGSTDSPYTVTVFASDGTYTANASFSWTIGINTPVTVTNPGDQSNNEGDTVSLAMAAADTGGTISTWSATGLPTGLSLNSSTGAITGSASTGGIWNPTITASDGSHSGTDTFAWNVSSPISIVDSGPQVYNASDTVSVPITATDTASGTLVFSASGLPTGLSISSSSGTISGTISSSLTPGSYTTTVSVTDGTNTALDSFGWTIYPVSDISITNPGTQSSTEGSAISTLSLSTSYTGSGTLSYAAAGLPAGLVINPSNGHITGTPAAGDAAFGPYSVQVSATDGTDFDSQIFQWNISSPITISSISNQTTTEGTTISTLTVSASGGSGIVYSAQDLPTGLSINPSSGDITGTVAPGSAALSPFAVTVVAAAGSYYATQDFNWVITSPISISTIADQTSTENSAISTLTVSASDSISGATLSYAATGLPPGLQIDPSTGAILGTPSVGSAQLGPYSVTVMAEDGTYATTQSFNWTIDTPISITTPADQTNTEGDSVSLSLSASDSVSGSTMTYAALGLPAGLVISPTTGAITGTIAAGASANGPDSVTLAVGDGTYNNETSFTWNINSPVVLTAPPADQSNNVGDTVSVSAAATDSISGATLSYSAATLPSGLSINSTTGAITGTPTTGGFWQTVVTASDGTYSATTDINWTVTGDISITDKGDQTNAIGDAVSVQIAATDIASGTLSFSATGLPTGLSINSSSGLISGTVGSGASTTTPYTPTITVTDGTNTSIDVFNWVINPSGPIVITSPGSLSNAAGDDVEMQLQASDSSNGTLMYAALNLPSGLYINPYTGYINGTVASGAISGTPYAVTIIASDSTNTAQTTFAWTISAAAGSISSSNPGGQTTTEGTTISTVSINATDSTTGATLHYMAFGLPPGLQIDPSTGAITGTVGIGAGYEGAYTVTVVANDGTSSAAQTFAWNVFSPITIGQLADQTNNENDSVSLAISATDAISGATVTYAALGLPAGLSISPSTGVISGTVAKNAAAYGPYSVTVIAQDGTYSAQMAYNWNVNSPVSITAPPDQTNNESDTMTLGVSATDTISGTTLVYCALGLPGGFSINSSTGVISGTVAVGDASIGSYAPTIIVSDGTYYNTQTFNWTINSAIAFNGVGDQSNTVGDTVSLLVNATDASSGTVTYAALGLPAGLSIDQSTGLISGTVSSSAVSICSFVTTVFASDGTYSSSDTFNWTISAAGTVTLATPSNQTGTEGTAITTLSLSATDSTSGATLSYFAQGLPAGLVLDPSTGAITGTPAIGDAAYGPYSVTVSATDGTSFAQETFTWAITDPVTFTTVAADQTNTEGNTPTPTFGATDATSGTVVYTASGLPTGLSINKSTGAISGTVALGASAVGNFVVTITANDSTYSTSQTFNWTIASPITLTGPSSQTSTEGGSVTVPSSSTDSSSGTVTYTALGLPQGLSVNSSTGAITGSVAVGAATTGSFNFILIANDGTYLTAQSVIWTVTNPITLLPVTAETFDASQAVSIQVQTSYTGSGTLSYSATGLPAGLSINSTGLISGTLSTSAANKGTFVNTVSVTDGTYTATETFALNLLGARAVGGVMLAQAPPAQPVQDQAPAPWDEKKLLELIDKVGRKQALLRQLAATAGLPTLVDPQGWNQNQYQLPEAGTYKRQQFEKEILGNVKRPPAFLATLTQILNTGCIGVANSTVLSRKDSDAIPNFQSTMYTGLAIAVTTPARGAAKAAAWSNANSFLGLHPNTQW